MRPCPGPQTDPASGERYCPRGLDIELDHVTTWDELCDRCAGLRSSFGDICYDEPADGPAESEG
jgi:hypothetical protein